jgi:TonB family protein
MERHVSAGHLSIPIGQGHQTDTPFLFDREPKRLSLAVTASLALDIIVVTLLALASREHRDGPIALSRSADDTRIKNVVWLSEPGEGGGGGGGGNGQQEPPRRARLPGQDAFTVPSQPKPTVEPQQPATREPDPIQHLNIPARESASAETSTPGTLDGPAAPSTSQGPGRGAGAGTGDGTGDGGGSGSGAGDGVDRGIGGGAYRLGNGVTGPVLLREVKPAYTSDAMRARIQGSVFLECVVKPDGSVGEVQVVRSLDMAFGLDLEAIKAARQWRFRPGTRQGEPVPVLVTIQLDFALR